MPCIQPSPDLTGEVVEGDIAELIADHADHIRSTKSRCKLSLSSKPPLASLTPPCISLPL
jgi:hypothetical protein